MPIGAQLSILQGEGITYQNGNIVTVPFIPVTPSPTFGI